MPLTASRTATQRKVLIILMFILSVPASFVAGAIAVGVAFIGFKVSEEEYAQLETAAQASGRTLGEWCRQEVLEDASDVERRDPALAEIVGVRLLLVNVLGPVAAGEKVTAERFNQLLEQISKTKHQLAAKLQQQASEKPQPEKSGGEGKR